MTLDVTMLSRLQFAFTVAFHIIFPTMSIGLALFLAIVEFRFLRTKEEMYMVIYRFWSILFALGFGMGVVTGIVMSFQFGTNFSRFAQAAGPVIGPIIGMEVVTAFFLEAGFLGIMLFGRERVGPKLHFAATCLVSLGTLISASFIMSVNSWMQTPTGVVFDGKHFSVINWPAVIFNPSFPTRAVHMILASWMSGCFLVAGVAAIYLLRDKHRVFAERCLKMSLSALTVFVIAQFVLGAFIVEKVDSRYQPIKNQAFEGHWETGRRAKWLVIIWPDQEHQRNRLEIGIPLLGSILGEEHKVDGIVKGLRETPVAEQPPMLPVFYGFRLMFVLELTMILTVILGVIWRVRGRLTESKGMLRLWAVMLPSGFLATVGGWITAECGRQPYTVYGYLSTINSTSPVPAAEVWISFALFISVYGLLLAGFFILSYRTFLRGPVSNESLSHPSGTVRRAFIPEALQEVSS